MYCTHKNGKILCNRLAQPVNIAQLPVWIRSYVKVYNNFGEAQGMLHKFFKVMETAQVMSFSFECFLILFLFW